jgi:glycosyltransferase involved in cell wall biosynthesis
MQVVVTVEARLHRTPEGTIWCDNQFPFPYEFWTRYLSAFSSVIVVARVQDIAKKELNWTVVEGQSVSVHALPYYVGPLAYLKNYLNLKRKLLEVLQPQRAFVLRVGSPIADLLQPQLKKLKYPYGVEVVGDPWDTFSRGSVNHPLRFFFRRWFTYKLKSQCKYAYVASYVTERTLQLRYPAPKAKLTIAASSISLTDDAITDAPKLYQDRKSYTLVVVGSLEDHRKGIDILLHALRLVMDRGHRNVHLKVVGEGKKKFELVELAQELKIVERVEFLGALPPGAAVRDVLRLCDIFVLPSRAEGLPRAMIEAMAQGMFCIGSSIAGIPELINKRWLCRAGDADDLANKMIDAFNHPELMNEQAKLNLVRVSSYHVSILSERRKRLYQTLRDGVIK